MNQSTGNFLEIIEGFHKDNRRLEHFARSSPKFEISTMPLTPFVYQFFLYNSLYQIDWTASLSVGHLVYYDSYDTRTKQGLREWQQQFEFEKFMRAKDTSGVHLHKAFKSLSNLELTGEWTAVVPDSRISREDGKAFFRRVQSLASSNEPVTNVNTLYSDTEKCRRFVYSVRCNIFHGSKTLGAIHDPDQKRRIKVYFEFLHSLMSAFFTVVSSKSSSSP